MRYSYPCILSPEAGGGFVVSFPDVPEALTSGEDRRDALDMAADALAAALADYVHERRDIPVPGALVKGRHLVSLPPIVAAKLALYGAMRAQGMTKVALAEKLGVSESAVRKLADPDHRSHIGRMEDALKILGRTLVIEDKAA